MAPGRGVRSDTQDTAPLRQFKMEIKYPYQVHKVQKKINFSNNTWISMGSEYEHRILVMMQKIWNTGSGEDMTRSYDV